MKIAITIWGNRISPVFDSANTLMIARVEKSKITDRQFTGFNPEPVSRAASSLNDLKVDMLICGAITDTQARSISNAGIQLFSFVAGNADEVLASFLKNPLRISDFLMPGEN